MQVQEAIGTRRTFRYLLPHKPVEREKIQKMLEAARIASHWGNVQALKAVVVERATASKEVLASLEAPVAGFQIEQAPVVIVWWLDFAAIDDQANRLRELVKARALGIDLEKATNALESFLIPFFEKIRPMMKQSGLTEMDCGQGIAQATLVAIDQGLGTAGGEHVRRTLVWTKDAAADVMRETAKRD
jgi:nitroreductase